MSPEALRKALEGWLGHWPSCKEHDSEAAVGCCHSCGVFVCQNCLCPSVEGVRCRRCRPLSERALPPALLFPFALARATLLRPWGLFFLGVVAFLLLAWAYLPHLRSPAPAKIPKALAATRIDAPYLMKASRLRNVGNLHESAGETEAAKNFYRDAQSACHKFLAREDTEPFRLLVLLGLGLLDEKLGRHEEAASHYRNVIEKAAKEDPCIGVARFYLGRLNETARKDGEAALGHYKEAKRLATKDGDFIDHMVRNVSAKGNEFKKKEFVALLAGTHASTLSLKGKIGRGIRRAHKMLGHEPEEPDLGDEPDREPEWLDERETPRTEETIEVIRDEE